MIEEPSAIDYTSIQLKHGSFIQWLIRTRCTRADMVLVLDGNSEIGAHVRSYLCYLICIRH